MKKLILFLLLSASAAFCQSTIVIGTFKSGDGVTVVSSGQLAAILTPGIDTVMSGIARFSPTEVDCGINGANVAANQAVRLTNSVTISGLTGHTFIVGDTLQVASMTDSTFNGTFTITATTATTITYLQTAGNATSGGGSLSALRAIPGNGACTVATNTLMQPSNTSWKFCVQPGFIQPGSCFVGYALGGTLDVSAQVATPTLTPAYSLVDTFSNQTINGNKTFGGNVVFGSNLTLGNFTAAGTLTANNGGALGGSFTGNPNLTGNVSIGGNVSVGGTLGIPGAFTTKTLDNICIADQQTGADLGIKINACIASGKEIWITQAGTISTQVLIQNLNSLYIRCIGWAAGPSGILLTDGITGNPAQPPFLIKATGVVGGFIRISGCNFFGSASTGNLLSIIGSGSNPAVIELDHNTFGSTTGNGIDSTGATMTAAGIYAQGSLDLNIHDNDVAANTQGIVLDTGVNVAHLALNSINGNTSHAINTIKAQHIEIGPNNDIENNATNTTDTSILMQGCLAMCALRDNWIEGNNGYIFLQSSGAVAGTVQVYGNMFSHNVNAPNPSANQVIDTEGAGTFSIHDNYFSINLNIARFIDFNPTANAASTKDIRDNIFELSAGVSVSQAALFWQAGANKSPIVIEGNSFGSFSTAIFNGASAIEISAGTTSARVANNSCFTNSGTLTNCVKIDSGATGVIVQGTTVSGTGTITNTVNDAGTNTVCMGAGCAAAITTGQIKVGSGTIFTGSVGSGTSIASNTAVQTFEFACTGTAVASNTVVLNHTGIVPACTNTTSARPLTVISSAGTLANLQVHCGTGGVNSSSGVFTVFDNGSSTTLTCTAGTSGICSDTTHLPTTSAAHDLQIKFTTQAVETLANCAVSFEKQ